MSNITNTNLLERANELIEELVSHPAGLDKQLINAVERDDLDEVHRLVVLIEGELAQEHFRNYDLVVKL